MATTTIIEKGSGDANSYTLPVYVYDPAGGTVSQAEAISAAENAAPEQVLGTYQDGIPSIEVLAENIYRVGVRYSRGDFLFMGSLEREDYASQAEALDITYAEEVAKFPGTAPSFDGIMKPGGKSSFGAIIQPGAQNVGKALRLNIAQFTPAYRKDLMNWVRAGVVNSVAFAGYSIGELQLVSFSAFQDSQTTFQVRLGWSYKPNVTSANFGPVTGVQYQGHDFWWVWSEKVTDRNNRTLYEQPKFVYVNRPRPQADLQGIGVNPPAIA